MKSNPFSNWWSLAFNGIVALLYGVLAIFIPEETLLTIITWFGIVILIIGIAMLIGVINNIRNSQSYAVDLIWTILTIAVGGLLTFYTQRSVEIFVIIIGCWALIIGIVQFYLMSKIDAQDKSRNTFLINGIISVVFGVILFFNPFDAAQALLIFTGILAFIIGVILIILAVKMKSLSKDFEA